MPQFQTKKVRERLKAIREPQVRQLAAGGLYWTRTSDPIDVNDVLYQLSQQTTHTLIILHQLIPFFN
jgi:hypothetical protein